MELDFTKPWGELWFGRDGGEGDIGLEIEAELPRGFNWRTEPKWWRVDKDGSLRNNGLEFILHGPVTMEQFDEAMTEWEEHVRGYKFIPSPRTSVHVHFNVKRQTLPQIFNFGLGYWLIEDWLMPFCGPSRKGNLFCLTNSCSDDTAIRIRDWLKGGKGLNIRHWTTLEQSKYSSFNFCPLTKLGSVEIRTMRGLSSVPDIRAWVAELKRLKDFCLEFKNPKEMLEKYVKIPKRVWISDIFSPDFRKEVFDLHRDNRWEQGMDKAFFDLVQIAHAPKSWDLVGKPRPEKQVAPFGRDLAGRILPFPNARWDNRGNNMGVWLDALGRVVGGLMPDPIQDDVDIDPPMPPPPQEGMEAIRDIRAAMRNIADRPFEARVIRDDIPAAMEWDALNLEWRAPKKKPKIKKVVPPAQEDDDPVEDI